MRFPAHMGSSTGHLIRFRLTNQIVLPGMQVVWIIHFAVSREQSPCCEWSLGPLDSSARLWQLHVHTVVSNGRRMDCVKRPLGSWRDTGILQVSHGQACSTKASPIINCILTVTCARPSSPCVCWELHDSGSVGESSLIDYIVTLDRSVDFTLVHSGT